MRINGRNNFVAAEFCFLLLMRLDEMRLDEIRVSVLKANFTKLANCPTQNSQPIRPTLSQIFLSSALPQSQ